jgi:Rrf2 family protein
MLSKKCLYALHALKYIASHPKDELLTIQKIATAENIPKKFLEVILCNLKAANIVASKKGKTGGYHLARAAEDVNILEVVRTIDGAVAMLPCVSLNFYESCGRCKEESTCGINAVFRRVRDETLKILSAAKVSDLKSGKLKSVLLG